MSDDQAIITQSNEAHIAEWLKAVDAVPESGYLEASDLNGLPDGVRVQNDSVEWTKTFLTDAANPYSPKAHVTRSLHRATENTYDMLRHKYACHSDTIRLTVIETVEFVLIRVEQAPDDLAVTRGEGRHKVIDHLAHRLLRMSGRHRAGLIEEPYLWSFIEITGASPEMRFSTAPLKNPVILSSWADRVDAGIHKNHWFFMGYKKRPDTSGRVRTLDGQHWFDGKCWKA